MLPLVSPLASGHLIDELTCCDSGVTVQAVFISCLAPFGHPDIVLGRVDRSMVAVVYDLASSLGTISMGRISSGSSSNKMLALILSVTVTKG